MLPLLALAVAGCDREKHPVEPAEPDMPIVAATALPPPSSAPAAAPARSRSVDAARDPDILLRSYAGALAARDWKAAARAWARGSGVTAATLKAAYDRPETAVLEVGRGVQEGAAGSVYYEAPATLRFGNGPPERGSLVLRRVNDVDGATPEQRRWHIERSTIGQGQ